MLPDTTPSRRTFLTTSAAAAAATSTLLPTAYAAGGDTLRVGLVGCGGRGTGAAKQALRADPNVKLVAMCDAFMDRLEPSLKSLQSIDDIADKIDVPEDRRFTGFDGYKQLLDSGVDVVLLCTPPGFRPLHLRAAIDAGKHVFCEKPVAVDPTGVRSVIETAKLAREKNLGLCSGFCYRYDHGKRETVKRIHDGMIGTPLAMHITYLTGLLWDRGGKLDLGGMEYQMRNWYYFSWLSGDFIVEQHCHNMDKAAWVFGGEMPVSCSGVGGRLIRTADRFGNIYDHFAVTFEYKDGKKLFSTCRQMAGCSGDVNDHVFGTKGSAQLMRHQISTHDGGGWELESGDYPDMYQVEHNELFASVRAGKPINDGEAAANSTMMAILGREAAYTGKRLSWNAMTRSKLDLTPAKYDWGPNPVGGVPLPGLYKLV